jgi:hypothetical protein
MRQQHKQKRKTKRFFQEKSPIPRAGAVSAVGLKAVFADARPFRKQKNVPGIPGRSCSHPNRNELRAGPQRQRIRTQDRVDRRVVAVTATRAPLPSLAAAATTGQHTLRAPRAGDERAARVAAFRAGGGLDQPGDVLGADRAATPAAGAAGTAQRAADGAFGGFAALPSLK